MLGEAGWVGSEHFLAGWEVEEAGGLREGLVDGGLRDGVGGYVGEAVGPEGVDELSAYVKRGFGACVPPGEVDTGDGTSIIVDGSHGGFGFDGQVGCDEGEWSRLVEVFEGSDG